MAEFIAFDEKVEVLGAAIMSVSAGLGERAETSLKKHKLFPVMREGWYRQQDWLNAFREISKNGFADLVMIGMKIPDEAVWPPDITSVHDALGSINVAYQMNHRGGNIGGYFYEPKTEKSGLIICENPYPSDFDYGIIYRTVKKFSQQGAYVVVRLNDEKPNRKQGADSCHYLISWQERI